MTGNLACQAEYLGHVIQMDIENEMSKEAIILRDMERAREGVKKHLEGPDPDIDQIIRSLRENRWTLSSKFIKAFPTRVQSFGVACQATSWPVAASSMANHCCRLSVTPVPRTASATASMRPLPVSGTGREGKCMIQA